MLGGPRQHCEAFGVMVSLAAQPRHTGVFLNPGRQHDCVGQPGRQGQR